MMLSLLLVALPTAVFCQEVERFKESKRPKVEAAPVQPAMSRTEIEAGLKSHDRALYIKQGWGCLHPRQGPGLRHARPG